MFATVLAQPANQDAAPGFDIFSLLLPLALAALIFMMFRRQRKTQKTIKEQRTQMVPGTEVMTNFGLFGTVISLDEANNKAVLETGPGTTATVHMQTLTKVVHAEPAADEERPAVPDDASSLTSPVADDSTHRDSDAATTADGQPRPGQDGTVAGSETDRLEADRPEADRPETDNQRDTTRDTRDN